MTSSTRTTAEALRIELAGHLNDPDGQVICEVVRDASGGDDRERLTAWLGTYLGLDISTTRLYDVDPVTARWVVADMLRGPVFGRAVRSKSEAARQARRLEDCFDAPRFYSTLRYDIDPDRKLWTSTGRRLFGRSYESGILVADDARVGMLWLADED